MVHWLVVTIGVLVAVSGACGLEGSRGVAIDGWCDVGRDPVKTGSDQTDRLRGRDIGLVGWAHRGQIKLSWEDPELPGLTGYRVVRYSYDNEWNLDGDSIRTFSVDGSAVDLELVDSEGLEPDRQYRYRVFPITTDGIAYPSEPLVIWTMPTQPPPPPNMIEMSSRGDLNVEYGILAPVTGIRVLRRAGDSGQWQHMTDEDNERSRETEGSHRWAGGLDVPDREHEYAVCLSNGHGYGKALLLNAGALKSENPPPTPQPIQNVMAVPTSAGLRFNLV